jgi:hypothetical protein
MPKKPLIDTSDLLQTAQKAIQDWHSKNDAETVSKAIRTRLDADKDEILMKLLGFNKRSWGDQWDLDHCNGRSGNSVAGDYLAQVQKEVVFNWLSKVELPSLNKKEEAELQRAYKYTFIRTLENNIRDYATKAANEAAQQIFEDLVQTPDIDKYLQTMNLLLNPRKTKE